MLVEATEPLPEPTPEHQTYPRQPRTEQIILGVLFSTLMGGLGFGIWWEYSKGKYQADSTSKAEKMALDWVTKLTFEPISTQCVYIGRTTYYCTVAVSDPDKFVRVFNTECQLDTSETSPPNRCFLRASE